MSEFFAYITHKDGIADDTALELINAARKIDADGSVTAVVTGSGADLDTVCTEMAASYREVWKIDHQAVAYPNAEAIRKALVNILPADGIVLIANDTLGMDLGPGLSIKMDSSFAADVVDFEGTDGSTLKLIRQEYAGQVSTHVDCDISAGAVITVRPGVFRPDESRSANGQVVDKSGDAGDLSVGRRFLEIVEAEVGDIDITRSEVLVSVGRGIGDEESIMLSMLPHKNTSFIQLFGVQAGFKIKAFICEKNQIRSLCCVRPFIDVGFFINFFYDSSSV